MANIAPAKSGLGGLGIDENEFLSSSLDIFRATNTDLLIENSKNQFYQPITLLADDSPVIEFSVKPSVDYIDLSKTRLYGKLKLQKWDETNTKWTDVVAADAISCCQLLPCSVFKQVSVQLNGVEICDLSTYTYPYKCFLENSMSYSKDSQDHYLRTSSMFIPDTAGKADTIKASTSSDKTHFDMRMAILKTDPEFCIPLNVDLFNQAKYLIPAVGIDIKLTRNHDNFYLLAENENTKYHLTLEKLSLSLRHVRVNSKVSERQADMLMKTPALYQYPEGKITTHTIPANLTSTIVQNVAQSELPQLLLCGLIPTSSLNGTLSENPFAFKHHNINSLFFDVNGTPFPAKRYTPDFSSGSEYAVREWHDLVETLQLNENYTIPLSYKDFLSHMCLFALDTSGHQCNLSHSHIKKKGYINLDIGFKTAPTTPLNLIVYSVNRRTLTIDGLRQVTLHQTLGPNDEY